jgi:class 3 adenylate cyclase/tetratricopeptide (TPR) repeat protein
LRVTCAECGTANAPSHKFCTKCGRPLGALAAPPAPATPFGAPESYTPKHLAAKILTARSALEGERKQVTVLFVDVSGFTALSERLDPEDVHRLMTRAFELMLAEVHRYEGTVNQFLGDGIMALFGAPISHEDHARRAVLAALGIRDALARWGAEVRDRQGITFHVRQGLNTGLVVVGSIGSDLRMDYTALGDTTNVAARLLHAAAPGTVVVSEATHRLAAGYFETRALGGLALKGKTAPVGAWEVVAAREARTRLEVEAERGLTPLVGRGRELELLSECYDRARAGAGQVVFVVGEPGIGKSRLLHELRRRLGDAVEWREGHCLSFGRATALHPVVDLLKRAFGLEERASEAAVIARLEAESGKLGDELRPALPYLKYLLSVAGADAMVGARTPAELRGSVFDALRRLLTSAAPTSPRILVFEDLHWMDATTEEFLRFLADGIPTSPVLLILTYRPGYTHPLGERTYHTRIALGALTTEDSARMAQAILAADALPPELRDLIAAKVEGNPFYLEELVKALLEAGAIRRAGASYALARPLAETEVPPTVQGVIMARIDRLAPASRRTLQLASVIGREFTRRLLDQLTDGSEPTEEPLRELVAGELIYELRMFPELAYVFKHALTHDVAYDSLLREHRRALHRRVGLAIEALYADRLVEHYEVLGHHFSLAEDWERALAYLQKAQEKAAQAFALRDALALNAQALDAARRLGPEVSPATLIALRRARSEYHFAVGDYVAARAEAERWLDLARQSGDRASESTALASAALATQWAEDFGDARAYAGAAIRLAEEVGDAWALARSNLTLGHIGAVTAEFEEATDRLDRVLVISRRAGDLVHQTLGLQYRALLPNWRGDYDQAAALLAEGVRIAREHDLLAPLLRCLWLQGIVLTDKGEYDAAAASLREALAFSEKLGDERAIPRDLNTLGWLHAECEDHERAVELGERAAAWAGRVRHGTSVERAAFVAVNNADVFIARGDLVLARDALATARRILEETTNQWMRWRYTLRFHITEGEFWLASGDLRRAAASGRVGLEQATRTGSRKYVARAWRLAGEIAVLQRDWQTAEQALGSALAVARSVGHPPQLWKTHAALGRLHDERRDAEAATHAYRAARDVIDGVVAGLRDPELRAGLARDPRIARIRDRASA